MFILRKLISLLFMTLICLIPLNALGQDDDCTRGRDIFESDPQTAAFFLEQCIANSKLKQNEQLELLDKLAQSYAAGKQYSKAMKHLNEYLAIKPKSANKLQLRGFIRFLDEQYEQALDDFEEVIALNPSITDALYYKARTLYELERLSEALPAVNTALQKGHRSETYPTLILKAQVLIDLNKENEAVKVLKNAIDVFPHSADAYYLMGNALNKMEEYGTAIDFYDLALKYAPNSALPYYKMAIIYSTCDSFFVRSNSKAVKMANLTMEYSYSLSPTEQSQVAWVYYRAGELEKAIEVQRNAFFNTSPDEPEFTQLRKDLSFFEKEAD